MAAKPFGQHGYILKEDGHSIVSRKNTLMVSFSTTAQSIDVITGQHLFNAWSMLLIMSRVLLTVGDSEQHISICS